MGEKSKFTPQTASPIFPSCMLTGQLSTPVLESTPFFCVVFFFWSCLHCTNPLSRSVLLPYAQKKVKPIARSATSPPSACLGLSAPLRG